MKRERKEESCQRHSSIKTTSVEQQMNQKEVVQAKISVDDQSSIVKKSSRESKAKPEI